MAFTIKQFNDLRGILFLMLMTIPSIATTNIDCNGKPFHCVNSTHFMICVDLGSGVSSTIDSFIIPCPAPTECHNTNRFECEFPAATTQQPTNEPVVITTDQITIPTVQANESTVQLLPDIITTVPVENLYHTLSTSTISESELSTPNPIFVIDSTKIDVFKNVNVSTSGSHAELEVGTKNIKVLNITSSTLDVFSETTVSPVITDFTSTTDNAIIFTQTDSNLSTINKITTVNLDVGITTTKENKFPTFTTTETVNLVTENKTETDINHISEKQLVIENITSSIQNQATYTTERLRNVIQVENNDTSITKNPFDQTIIANDQDQLRTDMAKERTVNGTNPLENVLINTGNTTTTLTDVSKDRTGSVTEQTTQIYVTTETLIASSIIPSDLSVPTETIIPVEPNTLIENKVLVDQDKSLLSVDRGEIEKAPRFIPKTNIEISTQDPTADYNLGNVAAAVINNSDVITGPSSELHNAVISSTTPTIDTTLIAETAIAQDAFDSIKIKSDISTSESSAMTDVVTTYNNYNNIVDIIAATVSLPSTDFPTLTTDKSISSTATSIDTTLIVETTITQDELISNKTTSETSTSEANVLTDTLITYDNNNNIFDNITTVSIPSTDSPTLTTDEKMVRTEPTHPKDLQNKSVVHFSGTNLKFLPDNSLILVTELEFNPTVAKAAVSESNINFESNVVTQAPKLDPTLQQLEVFNKPDSDTNVSNLNSQHNILSNTDLNAYKQDIKTETIITEPTFIETQKHTGKNEVNTRFQLLEHNTIPQPESEKSKFKTIHTKESSNDFASGSNTIFEPSSLPSLPTESFFYPETHTTKDQVIIETTVAGDNQLKTQNNNIIDLITNLGSSVLSTEATAPYYDVTESREKVDQLYAVTETNTITETINTQTPDFNLGNLGKIISELRKIEPTGYDISSAAQIEQTKTQLQGRIETIYYLPTIAANAKQLSTESTILENDKYSIKSTVPDTTFENQIILATAESNSELNPTLTDSTVSESNFFQSSAKVPLPKAEGTKSIDIINFHNLNAPELGLEKLHKVEAKGYKAPMEPTGHEIPSTAQNEQTKTQLHERIETIQYSPTIAADGKQISTESTIFHNEQYNIKSTVVDTMPPENQLTLATTESILELNPTVTDSAVSDSNLFFQSSVNVQLPKAPGTKSIDYINNQNLNVPEIASEKIYKIEAKEYKTPSAPMTERQTQLREIDFNTQQQKEAKTILGTERNFAEYDTISKLPVTESTRNVVDYNVTNQTISPDTILQLTASSVLEKTEPKVYDSKDSTKNIIENSSDFIKIKNNNTKYYSTGDLTTLSTSTRSISVNLDNKVQDHAFQTMASPQNVIVIPTVNSLKIMQYNQNLKSAEGFTTLNTPIEQIIKSKFGSKSDIVNINENSQNKAPNNKNTVDDLVPTNSNILPFEIENVNKPNKEISVPILEKSVIDSTPLSTTEKQEILPNEFHVLTDNTAYSNNNYEIQQAALSELVNNNKKVIVERTSDGFPLPEVSPIENLSIQNKYIDKHLIIKQQGPHTKESVVKELNNAVVNEGKRADIKNHTSTSYNDTKGKNIPTESARGNELLNKSFREFINKTSTENYSNLLNLNESDTSAFMTKNINQNFTVGNNTILPEAKIQTRNKLESDSIVELVKTSDILKIVPVTASEIFTPDPNIFNSEKDQTLHSEAVLSVNETFKSLQTVSGDNNVSKVLKTEKNNGAENTYSSIVSSKDGYQKNVQKTPEARVKSLAERDVSTTSNTLSTIQVVSSFSQNVYSNAGEAVNLATFDLLSSAKSGGFEEKNNEPLTEKPDDEETITNGNEGQNSKINKDSSFSTISSENLSVTTESVEVDNNGNNNNNIVQSNSKYETLTSKPTIEISTRPTNHLKNIQLPIVSEVSTQSTVRSTSQKLSLENNTPLPATTKAVTNDFVCNFNQRGRFADKHDCRKFYICHGTPQPLEGICPVYTVFSELRKQCTKNLSHCVRNNQFQCVSEGRFSDFLNDSIYYICARNKLSGFIRFKLRCQNGYHLNKTSVRCVLNTEFSQSISSDISKSNSEQSAALKVEMKSKDSSIKKLECKKKGKFPDPDNCRVYYMCKKTSKSRFLRKKKKCDSDEYFHKDKKKCVDAESYECK